jgi:hypothetical protein
MLATLSVLSATLEPDYRANYTLISTALRQHLLDGYDKVVPPTSYRSANYTEAGTDIDFQVRFFKVESVESARGRMRLKVWYRAYWYDHRLAWSPSDWNGVTRTFFQATSLADGRETSELWVPDLQPYNALAGIDATLDASIARVLHTGEVFSWSRPSPSLVPDDNPSSPTLVPPPGDTWQVFWSRPGSLDVLCRFSGLVAFPFDTLRCSIEIGGWMLSAGRDPEPGYHSLHPAMHTLPCTPYLSQVGGLPQPSPYHAHPANHRSAGYQGLHPNTPPCTSHQSHPTLPITGRRATRGCSCATSPTPPSSLAAAGRGGSTRGRWALPSLT